MIECLVRHRLISYSQPVRNCAAGFSLNAPLSGNSLSMGGLSEEQAIVLLSGSLPMSEIK